MVELVELKPWMFTQLLLLPQSGLCLLLLLKLLLLPPTPGAATPGVL